MLKWDVHIRTLYGTISMNLATLSRSRSFLNQNELSKIDKTKVHPSIDFALSIISNCNEYRKNIILRLQERPAQIITGNFDFINVRGQDIMNELGWQTVDKRSNYYVSSLMFKVCKE